jgi:hypothetical protein
MIFGQMTKEACAIKVFILAADGVRWLHKITLQVSFIAIDTYAKCSTIEA